MLRPVLPLRRTFLPAEAACESSRADVRLWRSPRNKSGGGAVRSGAKALALLAALAMTGVAACGSSNDDSASKDSGAAQSSTKQASDPAWLTAAQTAAT